jgi:hypothetical protein
MLAVRIEQQENPLMRDGKQAIRNLIAAWLDAVAARDLPKLLGLRKM